MNCMYQYKMYVWVSAIVSDAVRMFYRESVYQLLSQTTPENTSKNYAAYSIDPSTRYPNINLSSIKPVQVKHSPRRTLTHMQKLPEIM